MSKLKMTMTQAESESLNTELDQFRTNLVNFKGDLHSLAYRALVHFHNCGNVCYIQKLYDILNEDKLLRKSAFAKWVLEYSPAIFNEKAKTFTKNKNPNAGKSLYMDNKKEGATLLAQANAKLFWDIEGGEESVNPSTFDIIQKSMERLIKRAIKERDSGNLTAEEVGIMTTLEGTFDSILEVVTPHTTKELEKQVSDIEGGQGSGIERSPETGEVSSTSETVESETGTEEETTPEEVAKG